MSCVLADYIFEQSGAPWQRKLLLIDEDGIEQRTSYLSCFAAHGFRIVHYKDDLSFRLQHFRQLEDAETRLAVIATPSDYIPFDIYKRLYEYRLSWESLFPRLQASVIASESDDDLELICAAYQKTHGMFHEPGATGQFLREQVYVRENAEPFAKSSLEQALQQARTAKTYRDWFRIAEQKAKLDVLACRYGFELDTSELNRFFQAYVLESYGTLYQENDRETPVIVSRAMEYMSENSQKFAIIVMDGMSAFDWTMLSRSFHGVRRHRSAAVAMSPTITSVSRQCSLSNKNPDKLEHPWKQDLEKKEFVDCARELGYADAQIAYLRGYDADPGGLISCLAVIIMDCDDAVHAVLHGRKSMFQEMTEQASAGRLLQLTERLLKKGFDVYISADHGNTECRGIGRVTGSGVETETRSHRMVVLKDFANKQAYQEKYHLLEFPAAYLPKENQYLLCKAGESLDLRGELVMSHGGMAIDEVIVPFITIKAKENLWLK